MGIIEATAYEIWSFQYTPPHSPGTLECAGDFATCHRWCHQNSILPTEINHLVFLEERGVLRELIARTEDGGWEPAEWLPFARLRAALWANPALFATGRNRHAHAAY